MVETNGGKTMRARIRRIRSVFSRWGGPSGVVLGAIVIAAIMVALSVVSLYQGRLSAFERAEDISKSLALIAERDITRNFEIYALSLQAVVDGVSSPVTMALPPQVRQDVLFDRATTAQYLGSVLVLDEKGNIVLDAVGPVPRHGNFYHREYFQVHRDRPDAGLYISDPFQSQLRAGSPSIALSRRISRPDGSFAGIALMAINLEYFHDLFAGLALGPHGSMSLIGEDGVMVMRQPFDPKIIGRNIRSASTFRRFMSAPEGTFTDTASIDGVRRLYYFKHLKGLPLIIMTAQGEDDIYASWQHRALPVLGLMVVLALAFVALAIMLSVQLRRRLLAESELQLLARVDGLTGLNNRLMLGEILEHEWRETRRARRALSLLFVDIDHFKAYNDTYGHQAGDNALLEVARCISANIRLPNDSAARYGGEEFLIVLPDTPANEAAQIAERIRNAIANLDIVHASSEFGRVTASIGFATWDPERDADEQTDAAKVIKAADEALYHAKAAGRNKVLPGEAATAN
jgi:diguanylate cyclase (GGDEF)-like protein